MDRELAFDKVACETDTSLALRCQWETPGVGPFTYSCHVPDGDGPIDCPGNNPNNIINTADTIFRGWSAGRGDESSSQGVTICLETRANSSGRILTLT